MARRRARRWLDRVAMTWACVGVTTRWWEPESGQLAGSSAPGRGRRAETGPVNPGVGVGDQRDAQGRGCLRCRAETGTAPLRPGPAVTPRLLAEPVPGFVPGTPSECSRGSRIASA